jgi:hypothetical protein
MSTEIVDTNTGEIKALSAWQVMRDQAEVLVKSGFLPQAINTPEKALAIMQKGKELGIPPMEAMGSIYVIQGKPSVPPQLMLALARKTGELEDLKMANDSKRASVTIKRKGQSEFTTSFGIEEATAFGLMAKDNYKKQPGIMFQWRALAANLRVTFPDAISGLYSYDEMGAVMDEDGNFVNRQPIQMPKPKAITQTIETSEVIENA